MPCSTGTTTTPASSRGAGPTPRPGRSWSASSCCSRPPSPGCSRCTPPGSSAGRRRRHSRPNRPARPYACGAGWAIRAAPCACTRRRAPSSNGSAGRCPRSYDDLLGLPGVGDYTASAIASFAFGQRHVVLDTNVRRVLGAGGRRGGVPRSRGHPRRTRPRHLPASRRRVDGRDLGGRHHGARRARVHRPHAALRRLSRSRSPARGAAPASRRTTARPGAGRPGPAPTVSAEDG